MTVLKGTLRENVLKGIKTTLSKQILKLWIGYQLKDILRFKSHTPSMKNGMEFPKADKNEGKSLGAMTLDTASVQGNAGNNQSPPSVNDHYNSVLSANLSNGRFSSPRVVIAAYHTPPVRRGTFHLSSLKCHYDQIFDIHFFTFS